MVQSRRSSIEYSKVRLSLKGEKRNDSDTSWGSTFQADQEGPIKERPSSQDAKAKRRVRINESFNAYHNPKRSWRKIPAEKLWWTSQEFAQIQENAFLAAKKAEEEHQNNTESKRTFFYKLCKLYLLARNIKYELTDVNKVLSDKDAKTLAKLYSADKNRLELIGLEKSVVPGIQADLVNRRQQIYQVVNDIQEEHRKGLWSDDQVPTELSESCANFSQSSLLLAQMLARAQASN